MKIEKEKVINISKNLILLIFIFVVCFSSIFSKMLGNLDEIWVYNFARNTADGLLPYRDFNVITTPLLYIICGIFLKIFGNELIVMRALATIMMTSIFFISYLILKKITNKDLALVGLIFFLIEFKSVMCIDYNFAVLLIALILIYIEILKSKEKLLTYNFKYDFIIGIVAGLAILFKQTTGLAVCLACIGYKIFCIENKKDLKTFLKIALTRLGGALIPVCCFVIYLLVFGIGTDFLDYAVLGISTFSNKIPYISLLKAHNIFAIIVPIIILTMFVMLFLKKTKKEIYILFAYAISSFVVVYPISDKIHFLIGSLITFISFIYLVYLAYSFIIKKFKDSVQHILKLVIYAITSFITIFFTLSLFFNSIIGCYRNYFALEKESELKHFKGIVVPKELKNRIVEVDDFIVTESLVNNYVYILDAEATIYSIPLDKNNKDFDLPLAGNIGKQGEEGMIKRIEKQDNAIYLIKKDRVNWQNLNKVREYVIKNLRLIGESSVFLIYQK